MISQLSVFAHTIGSRAYHLLCAPDSPLNEVKDALIQFLKMVSDLEEKIKEAKEAQPPEVEEKPDQELETHE